MIRRAPAAFSPYSADRRYLRGMNDHTIGAVPVTHQPDDLIGARRVWSRDWGVRKLSTLPIGLNPVLLTGVSLSHPPGLRPPGLKAPLV